MSFDLAKSVQEWDLDYASNLPATATPEEKRPFDQILGRLITTASLRYQPFQNDVITDYLSKLTRWLAQFPPTERPHAFLLASKVVFVTRRQFEALQRYLFTSKLRRVLLDAVIRRTGLAAMQYTTAARELDSEMDATLFVGNSASSQINSFVHINSDFFRSRGKRRLVGPDAKFWCYPQERIKQGLSPTDAATAAQFEQILGTDRDLRGKRRLVVIEDFSGTGADLDETITLLSQSSLPLEEFVIAPVMITARALERLTALCTAKTTAARRFVIVSAYELRHKFRCFNTAHCSAPSPEPSYLDGGSPVKNLSSLIEALSNQIFTAHFETPKPPDIPLEDKRRHGFGGLALAFSFFSNTPDNTLPLLWNETASYTPLFKRASNFL